MRKPVPINMHDIRYYRRAQNKMDRYPSKDQQSEMECLAESILKSYTPTKSMTNAKPLPAVSHGDPTTQWFNAIAGRVFLTCRRSLAFGHWIEELLAKKLIALKRPSMLSTMNLGQLNVGTSVPQLYNACLLRVTADGEVEASFDVVYK